MKYLHSRLALAGVVVAWPLTQLGACAQKERNFNPGTGGDSNGGMAGEDSGATGGKGGAATAGKSGTSGGRGGTAGTSGGKGGTGGSTGGTGGATTGGTGGSGNTNAGGEAGELIDPTCTPTGAEVCDDGIDNDCDTVTDCVTLVSSFPDENGAAAGQHVQYTFKPKHEDGSYECRAVKGDVMPAAELWGSCARVSGDTVLPISAAATTADSTNGVWSTEVRLTFPSGSHSRPFRRQVYVHTSLNAVTPCADDGVADADWFAAAVPDLEDTGSAFDTSTVRNPFVQIKFSPPVDGRYAVLAGDGLVTAYSLRRRFAFSDDGHFMLITRTYPSRLGNFGCNVARKRVHNKNGSHLFAGNMSYQDCAALVMNTNGAGYCLTSTDGVVSSAEWVRADYGAQLADTLYSPRADNFAWRKIFDSRTMGAQNTHFSPACEDEGCGTETALFLPDAALYTYWPL
jgi:hypothetical protein